MLPALDNYISYGSETLVQTPAYLSAVIGMVEDIFRDDKVGGVDRICGCKLAETLMLNLRGHIDQFIPLFIEVAMTAIDAGEARTKSYRIHLMEMIINAIYYNPVLSLQVLEAKGWTNKFFSMWFSNIDNFRRVHDKKLSIAAISSLLTMKAGDVPVSVQQGWPRLLQGATRLFQTLPAALKRMYSNWFLPNVLGLILMQSVRMLRRSPTLPSMMTLKMMRRTTGMARSSGTRKRSRRLWTVTFLMRAPPISSSSTRRLRSSALMLMTMTRIWMRRVSSRLPWTRSSRMACSSMSS